MDRNSSWMAYILIAFIVLAFSMSAYLTPIYADAIQDAPLCGNGSAPDYGLNYYDLLQPHWTVGWEGYASEQAVSQVDMVLDELNTDSIAQTMILIKPQEEVGIATNCSVHFLRYMQLGLPTGERKDNGFVFLIVVQPDSINVHYAVGLGLPALTAQELTKINRAAEAAYESTKSIDQALLTLVNEFDKVARDNYPPLNQPAPTPEYLDIPAGPVGIASQLCIGMFVLFFLFWIFSQIGRGGGGGMSPFNPYGGSRSWGGGGFRGFPSGGGRSGPRMRGGSGSGRSGRTN